MQLACIILLLSYIGTTHPSIYGDIKESFKKLLRRGALNNYENNIEPKLESSMTQYLKEHIDKASDAKTAKRKSKLLQEARTFNEHFSHGRSVPLPKKLKGPKIGDQYYRIDPVLNQIRRRHQYRQVNARRQAKKKKQQESSDSGSSTMELKDWKEEFKDDWLKKKFEAINSTIPRGDVVHMAAARPWGVACGDPNQHDMPWGNCMLASECDSEYRIFRGDNFCGRSQYVCCALQLTTYDLYGGFDISFADTDFATDSAEKKGAEKGSKEKKNKKKNSGKNKRAKERNRRKRQMKKNIRKIVHEIRKILNRSFRNASHHRKQRTQLLKKYIRDLKKQYRKDRLSVRDIHENDIDRIDAALEKRLEQIKAMNKNFMTNATFRDIVVNGTMSHAGARMLAQAYPELKKFLRGKLRRDGRDLEGIEEETNEKNDYLEYDIEYGALYY